MRRPSTTTVRQKRAPQTGTAAIISTAAGMLALVTLWGVAQLLVLSDLAHDRAQTVLYRDFRVQVAETTAPLGPVIPVGDPVAIVTIPAVGVQEVVVEGTASGDLQVGPGHLRSTVLPGQAGVSVLLGRGMTYGAPFGAIGDLRPGASIEVLTSQGEKTFTVIAVRREGDPLPQPLTDGSARLTLVSTEGSGGFLAPLRPSTTVYVDAETDDAFGTPSGRPTAVPSAERPMATDGSALPLLALCLALLLGLTLGVVFARQRFATSLVWVVASPVALALAWATTDTVVRLLPNLI